MGEAENSSFPGGLKGTPHFQYYSGGRAPSLAWKAPFSQNKRMRPVIFFGIALFCAAAALSAENWPQWRGPQANGISAETNLPVRWSPSENVAWKAPLTGLGTSTPIVWEDRIFLTSQVGNGPSAGGNDFENAQTKRDTGGSGVEFLVQAFARDDGRKLWEHRFEAESPLVGVHVKHNLASPSCVTDGERVYAWFGNGQTLAFTLAGDLVWQRHLGKEIAPFEVKWGHGSSPLLYEDELLLLADHPDSSYLLALDPNSGKQLRKMDRGEKRS
jgi:outer membrane protein assembly factor BamB